MEFDLSQLKFSYNDIKRGLTLPKTPSKELAEFVGIIIGDGYLHDHNHKYVIGIVGNPKTDGEYFSRIQTLIFELFHIKTKVKVRERGLRLVFGSKGIFLFLTRVIGLEFGNKKGQKVMIPQHFIKENKFINYILRGVFDTDGTIFKSNKKGYRNYPCIELTTTSIKLANQVKDILINMDFRVAGVRKYKYKHSNLISNKVSLYGKNNALLWYSKIGFSNPNKNDKLVEILVGTAEFS